MAQVLNLNPLRSSSAAPTESSGLHLRGIAGKRSWNQFQRELKCNGKFTCLFSSGGREEQAKKALESALGGKKSEFEKWDKEIKKREEARTSAGGGDSGGGGWFGSGGPFGWSGGDNFWPEAQQTSLALLGILGIYLLVAKGDLMLATVCNPVLRTLRGARDGLTLVSSKFSGVGGGYAAVGEPSSEEAHNNVVVSAKERVLRKWGSD
ncbi:unnamed protein product [Linum tenue]|uniref:Uncharacterized protein n=1 Tax=Linum tenue TaxID=586396 RepID=A0AAV0GT90_9ROSI|nr:unnamed protein product [Linum tenue]